MAVLLGEWLGPARSFAKPPTLTGLFPPGAGGGRAVAVEAAGTFDRWPVRAWVEGGGVELRAEKEKGRLKAVVAADAAPGLRWVRLYDQEGASALRPFVVGVWPEVVEVEPNDEPGAAQRLDGPSMVVNGRLAKAGDVDGFAIALRRGQCLVADVDAERPLGSPMDAVLQVADSEGIVLAQDDDDVGRDPRVVFEATADGTYLVRLFAFPSKPDASIRFAGGADYLYRLTLTTGGFLDSAFPMAVGPGGPGAVEAVGWNIPATARLLPVIGTDVQEFVAVSHADLAGTARVRRVPFAAVVEAEPNDRARPQAIPSPVALSGRIDAPGDRDVFRLSLRKGDRRVIRVEAQELGRPLDPVLRILDAAGKVLAEADDTRGQGRDCERSFTAPADGAYDLVVHDLNGRGGPRFAYLLSVLVPGPDFTLGLASDRFDLAPGKTTKVAVAIGRTGGHAEPIEIVAEGLPTGVTSRPATALVGQDSVRLELSAGDGAASGPLQIVGRTTGNPRMYHSATAPIPGFEERTDRPWLTIRR